jgi:NAD(P) transhydrogenase subunit alpha
MPESLLNNLYIFILAMFTGFEVITKVPPLLHTPLMSGSNAISGISVVGALVITAAATGDTLILILGVVAVAMGMINVAGGFLVTDRMLEMFKERQKPAGGEEGGV